MQIVPTKVAQFDTCMSGHCILSPKPNNYISFGWTRRDSSPKGGQNTPRGGTDGINN